MTAEKFRAVREAHPFRPFVIHLADGRDFRVPHRDFVWQSPAGRTIVVAQPDDSFSILDLYLVTELEVEAPAEADEGNQ